MRDSYNFCRQTGSMPGFGPAQHGLGIPWSWLMQERIQEWVGVKTKANSLFIFIVDTITDVPMPPHPLPAFSQLPLSSLSCPPHCCLCLWVMHICSLADPFTFFHPVFPPPSQVEKKRLGLTAVEEAKVHMWVDKGKLMSELYPVYSQFLKLHVFPRVGCSLTCAIKF